MGRSLMKLQVLGVKNSPEWRLGFIVEYTLAHNLLLKGPVGYSIGLTSGPCVW